MRMQWSIGCFSFFNRISLRLTKAAATAIERSHCISLRSSNQIYAIGMLSLRNPGMWSKTRVLYEVGPSMEMGPVEFFFSPSSFMISANKSCFEASYVALLNLHSTVIIILIGERNPNDWILETPRSPILTQFHGAGIGIDSREIHHYPSTHCPLVLVLYSAWRFRFLRGSNELCSRSQNIYILPA